MKLSPIAISAFALMSFPAFAVDMPKTLIETPILEAAVAAGE